MTNPTPADVAAAKAQIPAVLALYMEASALQVSIAGVPTYREVSDMITRIMPAIQATQDFANHAHAFNSASGVPETDEVFNALDESARSAYIDLRDLQSALLRAATILERFVHPGMIAETAPKLVGIYQAELQADAAFEASRQQEWTASAQADLDPATLGEIAGRADAEADAQAAGDLSDADPLSAVVYLIAADKWGARDYLGFGFSEEVLDEPVASRTQGLILLSGPARSAEWQAERLASGMLLRNGDGRGRQPYATSGDAIEAMIDHATEWSK